MPSLKQLLGGGYVTYLAVCAGVLVQAHLWGSVIPKVLLCLWCAVFCMAGLFVVAHRARRYDMVDVGWGLCFVVVAGCSYTLGGRTLVQTVLLGMVTLWGARLAWHIGRRVRCSTREDMRYVELRQKWSGSMALNTFLRVYMLQALLVVLVSVPVIHLHLMQDVDWSRWVYVGLALWVTGFVCEVVADAQLASCIASPEGRGKLMTKGLWKYARHPNYFGELLMWWGIGTMALGTPYGWVGLSGALLITYLICCVSGIPPKEKRLALKPGWEAYKDRTRLLLPIPKYTK